MTDNLSQRTDVLIEKVLENVSRRKDALEKDFNQYKIVENNVISCDLSNIPGMTEWLKRSRQIKESYAAQEIIDTGSHMTQNRYEVHRKYTKSKNLL